MISIAIKFKKSIFPIGSRSIFFYVIDCFRFKFISDLSNKISTITDEIFAPFYFIQIKKVLLEKYNSRITFYFI